LGCGGWNKIEMGRTIPSFRIALAMEKEEWKPFRNAFDKSDRREFNIPRLFISQLALYYMLYSL
jgi:hypothetical protein